MFLMSSTMRELMPSGLVAVTVNEMSEPSPSLEAWLGFASLMSRVISPCISQWLGMSCKTVLI